jgi:hypothetical protein
MVEYPDPTASLASNARLVVREVLDTGELGAPLVIAGSGTNVHVRMVADKSRNLLWLVWMEYIGDHPEFLTGSSNIKLVSVKVS